MNAKTTPRIQSRIQADQTDDLDINCSQCDEQPEESTHKGKDVLRCGDCGEIKVRTI